MYLYRFSDDTIISAPSQAKAASIALREGVPGVLHTTPTQIHGSIEFAFEPGASTGLAVWIMGDDGKVHAIADADAWAEWFPNQKIEHIQSWGEQ